MTGAAEWFVYASLFIALYFEVFVIVSFFNRSARARRNIIPGSAFPKVAVIVPCYNEGVTIDGTVRSLLALEYPKDRLSIILVNDGSKDTTREVMESYRGMPQIQVFHKENGGKHTALNLGIEHAGDAEFIGCLDADSFVEPGALKEIVAHFDNAKVGAVTASLVVFEPKSAIERMQYAEYLLGITLRHVFASLDALYVTPGPFTIFRKQMFDEIGNFRPAHNTEDMEIAMRMQKTGWKIGNAPRARVFTKAPRTAFKLIKQRTRWTTGFLRNGYDYRELFFNPRYGVLGLLVLPLAAGSLLIGIGLFLWSVMKLLIDGIGYIAQLNEVPFHFSIPAIDWFYAPVSALAILSVVGMIIMAIFMALGARTARAYGSFGPSVVWYMLLYSLIAPFWVLRSFADVALGVRRSWR